MPQNYFRTRFQKRFSPNATIRGMLVRYLQLHNWDPVHDWLVTTPIKIDLGGLMVIEYGDHTS